MVPQHSAMGALSYSGVEMRSCRVARGIRCDPLSTSWPYSSNGVFEELMLMRRSCQQYTGQDRCMLNGEQCHPSAREFASARCPARGVGGRWPLTTQSLIVLHWANRCAVRPLSPEPRVIVSPCMFWVGGDLTLATTEERAQLHQSTSAARPLSCPTFTKSTFQTENMLFLCI
jgi:hypothetical protein